MRDESNREFFRTHPRTKWTGIALGGLLAALILFTALFDWNLLRPAAARKITAITGRPARIEGNLRVHLWSLAPRAEIEGLSIANPPWADQQTMFSARKISVTVSLPRLLIGQIVVAELQLQGPSIDLERDSRGRASWELGTRTGKPNHNQQPTKVPTIRRLLIEDGSLHVSDQIRKLRFSGSLVAAEQSGSKDSSALKIRCSGTLNAKPFRLEANGGPLLDLTPRTPYAFSADLAASDITLQAQVTVRKPFDLGALDVKFVVAGNDLADVFYLTGLALPNTPKYRLAATLHLDGTRITVDDLNGHLGSSDLRGHGQVQTGGDRPKLIATLASNRLDMVDVEPTLGHPAVKPNSLAATQGPKTKARAPAPPPGAPAAGDGRLLPDADLQANRVRGMDADVTYQAAAVTMPKVPIRQVSFHIVLDRGVMTMDPVSIVLEQGKVSGKVRIDARPDIPVSDIDMRIENVDLSQFHSDTMKQSPLGGEMRGRFEFHGTGSSIHKFASSSTGTMSVVIPHGQISDVLAELTGINVAKGLGLLLAKGQQQTEIRCGIVDFKDHDGKLNTTTVYVDTSNVLITGRGDIDLGSENLNLALQGDPKKLRLIRVRSPISLHGTLLHPAVGVKADKLAEQIGVAAALGTLLTPVAAAIAFIDPGLAKDKNCSTVLAQADAGVEN